MKFRVVTYFKHLNPAVSMVGQVGNNSPKYRNTLEAAIKVAREEKEHIDRSPDAEYVKTDITQWAFVKNIKVEL